MFAKLILAAATLTGLALSTAMAQTTTDQSATTSGSAMTRDPAAGDPVAKPATRRRRAARQDAPAPGATNGNAPDRAMAGGGGR